MPLRSIAQATVQQPSMYTTAYNNEPGFSPAQGANPTAYSPSKRLCWPMRVIWSNFCPTSLRR